MLNVKKETVLDRVFVCQNILAIRTRVVDLNVLLIPIVQLIELVLEINA